MHVEEKDERGREHKRRRGKWEKEIEKSIKKYCNNQEPNL